MAYEATGLRLGRSSRLEAHLKAKGLERDESGRLVTAAEAQAAKPRKDKASANPPRAISGYEVQLAATNAQTYERRRWADVMLADVAKGRERVAAAMLAAGDESAATIRSKLTALPTTAEHAAEAARAQKATTDAVWERAYNRSN